ncbi:hypothetical protein D3C87_1812380 [compost metagenome]
MNSMLLAAAQFQRYTEKVLAGGAEISPRGQQSSQTASRTSRKPVGKLCEDKLDGVISEAFWLTKHREYQEELDRIRTKLRAHQVADAKYLDYGVHVLKLARTLDSCYSQQYSS